MHTFTHGCQVFILCIMKKHVFGNSLKNWLKIGRWSHEGRRTFMTQSILLTAIKSFEFVCVLKLSLLNACMMLSLLVHPWMFKLSVINHLHPPSCLSVSRKDKEKWLRVKKEAKFLWLCGELQGNQFFSCWYRADNIKWLWTRGSGLGLRPDTILHPKRHQLYWSLPRLTLPYVYMTPAPPPMLSCSVAE